MRVWHNPLVEAKKTAIYFWLIFFFFDHLLKHFCEEIATIPFGQSRLIQLSSRILLQCCTPASYMHGTTTHSALSRMNNREKTRNDSVQKSALKRFTFILKSQSFISGSAYMRGSDGNRTPIVDVHEMCITFTLDLIEFNSLLLNKMFFSVHLMLLLFCRIEIRCSCVCDSVCMCVVGLCAMHKRIGAHQWECRNIAEFMYNIRSNYGFSRVHIHFHYLKNNFGAIISIANNLCQ